MAGEEKKKEPLTVQVALDVMERVKRAIRFTPGATLEGLVEEALREAVDQLEKIRGKPFPQPLGASRLRSFELFKEASEENLAEIAQEFAETSVPQGTILFRRGQVVKDVYLLEEGSLGIFREEAEAAQFSAVLQPQALVGGKDLLDPERIRSASAKALTDLRLLTISMKLLLSFLRRFPPLKEKLKKIATEGSY